MEREAESAAEMIRAQLRRLRIAAGLTQDDFGKLVHYSDSMVSAIELGQRPLDQSFLSRADEVLDTGGLLVYLLEQAQRYRIPSWFRPWREAEQSARQLCCWQPNLIPGLLQTENYARVVLRTDDTLSDGEVDRRLTARLERQAILTSDQPPQFIAVLDESALRRVGEGFTGLMAEQLQHLLACAERPNTSIHVVPADVVMHVGLSGPFVLARSAEGGWLGHLEHQLGGIVVDSEADLARLLGRWETVRNDALPRRQSIDLIKEVVNSWA